MERTPLDNGTILICSEGTNIYRFVSAKEHYSCCTPSDHVYRKPGGRTIRTLHAVWALHRPTKATASVAHWNSGPLTVLQIQFKKPLKLFHCLSLQDKRTLPPACILSTYMTMGGEANLISGQTYSIIQRIFFHMHTFSLLNTNVNWFVVILQLSDVKSHFHIFSHIHRQYKIEKYKSTIGH